MNIMWPENPEMAENLEPTLKELWLAITRASEITEFVSFYCSEVDEIPENPDSMFALPEELIAEKSCIGTHRGYIDYYTKCVNLGDKHVKIVYMSVGDCLCSSITELWCHPDNRDALRAKFNIT